MIYSYRFSILLLGSIFLGGFTGYFLGPKTSVLKPFGEIFLNLLLTVITPLVFCSVASIIAKITIEKFLKKILFSMTTVFLLTGLLAAVFMLLIVIKFPPAQGVVFTVPLSQKIQNPSISNQLAHLITAPNLMQLFLPKNILALIVFSVLVGLAITTNTDKTKLFLNFLQSCSDIFMKIISFIMYFAPIGLFAFFAVVVSEVGPKLFASYFRTTLIYYPAALFYFSVIFSLYAYLANKKEGLAVFWKNILTPAFTAFATCSSIASLPINLQAAKSMKIAPEIYETILPFGTILNKQGSILGGVIKIAFLFGIFHMQFLNPWTLFTALLIAMLVGTVMGAIPSGGLLGEMLILAAYGFPPEALFMIVTISIIIDPIATVLNVTGNTVNTLLVARLAGGPNWSKTVDTSPCDNA